MALKDRLEFIEGGCIEGFSDHTPQECMVRLVTNYKLRIELDSAWCEVYWQEDLGGAGRHHRTFPYVLLCESNECLPQL